MDGLQVIEVDSPARLAGLREVPYAAGGRDPGSLAGIWEALARS